MIRILLISLSILLSTSVHAQFESYEAQNLGHKQKQRDTAQNVSSFVFGGDFGLQLGTNTFVKISPAAGRYFTQYFLVGASLTYIYTSNKLYNTRGNIYGGSFFLESYPFSFAVLHAEYERLWVDLSYIAQPYWSESYLAGAGYRQTIGQKGMINYLLLWDFNYSGNKIYSNPRFKIILLF